MLIDHHAHWLPGELLEMLAERTQPPLVAVTPEGCLFTASLRPRLLPPVVLDLSTRARYLDRIQVGRQCLSLSPLWNIDGQPLDTALPLVRAFNDGLAKAVMEHREFEGWAAVPTAEPAAACDELQRAAALGLGGVVFPAALLATVDQAEHWRGLFGIAESRGLLLFVHPAYGARADSPLPAGGRHPWHARAGLNPQHQIGTAMMTLCQAGWLANFPKLRLQFANLGGSFPGALERLSRMGEENADSRREREQALLQVTVDTASMGPRSIRYVRQLLGDSAVVFGTDMPMFDPACACSDWHAAEGLLEF